jgi:hypothetical protein
MTRIARRAFLQLGATGLTLLAGARQAGSAGTLTPLEQRLASWEEFGWHWTGSSVQQASAEWLAREAGNLGMRCEIQTFSFQRAQVDVCSLRDGDHHALGLPLFNHANTPESGLTGVIAVPPAAGDIALLMLPPQARVEEALAAALANTTKGNPYRAAVVVTTGALPGLAPLDVVMKPMPLPVIQVSSEALGWINQALAAERQVTMLSRITQIEGTGRNVVAVHAGEDQQAAPLVVSTGMSGWGPCTGERGGPLSIWLQICAGLGSVRPQRGVVMLAADGEELGGLGRSAFLSHYADLVAHAPAWLELGANLGSRDSTLSLQGEEQVLEGLIAKRLAVENLRFERRATMPEDVPLGPAVRLALHASPAPQFHLPGDLLPSAVDLRTLGALGAALARSVAEMAAS